jgi:Damage-control phosphatase ARMT1-like domain
VNRPPAIRTDGSNPFARYSMKVRVPKIARDTIERNGDYPPAVKRAVERLAADIEGDAPLPRPRPPAPDVVAWTEAHAERAIETWLTTEWFHAELAFYRELVAGCRFWETDRDPFRPAKEEELASETLWERLEAALARPGSREERVFALLDDALWANRVDLSYSVGTAHARVDSDLLADERATAVPRLVRPGASVHVVLDNTGTELGLDLALVGALLEEPAARATLHLKMQPVFVSDAMPRDVWELVARMRARGGDALRLAERLTRAFDEERLALVPDPFWSGPRFLWQAPPHVLAALRSSTIVVCKGDANYRRVVGDAMWPASAPFAAASGYLAAPIVCLRTMKSDALVGIADATIERLDAIDPQWRVVGKYGLIQTHAPTGR